MAGKKTALAAGAARAKGERAKREGTPLIGAEPVEVAPTIEVAPPRRAAGARRAKAAGATRTARASTPAASTPAASTPATTTPATTMPATTTAVTPDTAEAPASPTPRSKAHRPKPTVTSAPSPKATRATGERKGVPRLSPRAKRLADERAGARAHLSLASSQDLPPADHDSFGADAFRSTASAGTSSSPRQPAPHPVTGGGGLPGADVLGSLLGGIPLPDLSAAVSTLVMLLRTGAQLAGLSPDEIERAVAAALAYLRRRVEGDYVVDDFGYDQDFTESLFYPLLRPIYQKWFRVEVRGVENIPLEGPALVVSNHSGTVAIDSLMLQLAIHDETPTHRAMRALGADLVFETPFLGTMARRAGSTLATSADAERLFAQGELVGVFPEGFKGVGKPFKDRYKLQRFGRGGFVSAALKAQVPIIPVAIVGAEEIAPIIGNMPTVARLLGLPYAPITPTFPLLGPLGLIPLPSKWIISFGEPIHTESYGPDAAEDPMLVFDLTDEVRETIQQSLHEVLVTRRSVFF